MENKKEPREAIYWPEEDILAEENHRFKREKQEMEMIKKEILKDIIEDVTLN